MLSLLIRALYVVAPPYTESKTSMMLRREPSPLSIAVLAVKRGHPSSAHKTGVSDEPGGMAFSDIVIYITPLVIVCDGIV